MCPDKKRLQNKKFTANTVKINVNNTLYEQALNLVKSLNTQAVAFDVVHALFEHWKLNENKGFLTENEIFGLIINQQCHFEQLSEKLQHRVTLKKETQEVVDYVHKVMILKINPYHPYHQQKNAHNLLMSIALNLFSDEFNRAFLSAFLKRKYATKRFSLTKEEYIID